jgi:tetratricopeptide (TPR) repeat protein
MSPVLRAAIVASLCVALTSAAAGQNRRWADPYRQGRDLVKDGKYDAGIPLLLEAIKVAPRQERNKHDEGTFYEDYFPYYYLGMAYLRLRRLPDAERAFAQAKECRCLSGDLSKLLIIYENDLQRLLQEERDRNNAATGGGARGGGGTAPNPAFLKQLQDADAAAAAGRYQDALRGYDALRSMDPAEYAKRNLGARRADLAGTYAQQFVRLGDQATAGGQLNDAQARYQDAETLSPGAGRPGLNEIQRRRSEYARLKGAAETDAKEGRMDAARDKARQAQSFDPEQFRTDNLLSALEGLRPPPPPAGNAEKARDLIKSAQAQVAARNYAAARKLYQQAAGLDPQNADAAAWIETSTQFESLRDRGQELQRQGKLSEAMQTLEDARRRDEQRFVVEGLDGLLKRIADRLGDLPEAQLAPIRTALVAYLQGDVASAASMLEPLAAGTTPLDPRARAHVHAWLGAAYADLSLAARADEERTDLRQKALAQFQQLVALQPEYRLSEMLISPPIRALLDQARSKR